MRSIALMTSTVLIVAAIGQADVVYDFDSLPLRNLHRATDGTVDWTAVSSRRNRIKIVADPSDASNHLLQAASTRSEQVISVPDIPGSSVLGLAATDTQFSISYTGTMSDVSGFVVGLWMDGVDRKRNGSTSRTIEQELALQFGVDATTNSWRLVGANGANDTHSSAVGLPVGLPSLVTVTLEANLLGNSGDGSATLTILDRTTNTTYTPYAGLSLGLLANPGYSDPSKYTGWYVQNSQVDASRRCGTQVYPATLDNLTLTVIPEPASLTVLILGGLVLLRPRRR